MRTGEILTGILLTLSAGAWAYDPAAAAGQAPAEKQKLLWQKMESEIHQVDRRLDGVMALAVMDLTSNEQLLVHADEVMPQASSIKIIVLAELYKQAEEGRLKLTDEYIVRQEDMVPGSDIMLGLTPGITKLTLRDLSTMMIAVSDNAATNVLIERIGMESANARMRSLGLRSTLLRRKMMDLKAASEGRENVSTPRDMMTLLSAIYYGRFLNPELTKDFWAILSTHNEDDIRRGLPEGVEAAVKPGSLEAVRTDSGVIFVKGRPYVLCVMTAYLRDERDGEEAIAKIAGITHSYFDRVARASEYGRVVSPK